MANKQKQHYPRIAVEIDKHIGDRIRQQRKEIGLSMVDLGARLKITHQQIQKYEVGKNRVPASRLFLISRALSVPITFFFEGVSLSTKDHTNEL